ncbi:hypothetical protein EI969_11210 [Pseudomonas sp. PB101]|jgi:hypothetical protein|nr:hypothetical protein [Pseudomonas sp. PB101]
MDFFRQLVGELEAAIAGKPAPTGFVNTREPCGSWLASDEALPYTADLAIDGLGRITLNP